MIKNIICDVCSIILRYYRNVVYIYIKNMETGQYENIQHNPHGYQIFLFLTKGFYCEYFNLDNTYYVYVT